ncbi:hypothetical protein L6472_06155 [Prevotella sp. E13-17]|uniref:hypothetical protein n=1 Tax=Prevotella sp. E13-17 TaxID=2913616 RepID=UPI001EDBB375|nr:hypothetical protein [Prevotella sp. E13-17]UKK52161.1 hypothetical protein L6472_06155 [Prevotella sp. E13-17]
MPYPSQLHKGRCIPGEILAIPHDQKLVIEIILLKNEIEHDIHSEVARVERSRKLTDTPILTNDDADKYTIDRSIDDAISTVVGRCQAYMLMPSPFVHRTITNHVYEWQEKSIYLAFPYNFPPGCVESLRMAIHRFIVKSVVFELLTSALPNDPYTQICSNSIIATDNEINALLNARLGAIEIHPTFLG